MTRCFYCMDENHTASDCKFKQADGLDKDRKRRIKEWGYMPTTGLMIALTQHFFVPRHLPWSVYFFRYAHMEEILHAGVQSGRLTNNQDIYADPQLVESERLLKMGQEKLKEGAYQPAVVILDLVLEKEPQNYRAHITKGYAYVEHSALAQALASFDSAQGVAPADYYRSLTRLLMARVSQCSGELEQAIAQAHKALDLNLAESHYLLSLLYVEQGLVKQGLAQLQLSIERNREFLVASCYEPGFSNIESEMNPFLASIIKGEQETADRQLKKLPGVFKEIEGLEAELCDPADFKNARLKYSMGERKYKTHSYFGYIEANRLFNEAAVCLGPVSFSNRTRQRLISDKIGEHKKTSLKFGAACGICAAGWGLVIGGGIGIVMMLKFGPENMDKIVSYAIKGALISFIMVFVYAYKFSLSRYCRPKKYKNRMQI